MRSREAAARRLLELAVVPGPEVDGHPVDAEQFGDSLDGRLERVRDGQLRSRLHDHLEQRPRPLELEREEARALAGAQRVRRANSERREVRELLRVGFLSRGVEEL